MSVFCSINILVLAPYVQYALDMKRCHFKCFSWMACLKRTHLNVFISSSPLNAFLIGISGYLWLMCPLSHYRMCLELWETDQLWIQKMPHIVTNFSVSHLSTYKSFCHIVGQPERNTFCPLKCLSLNRIHIKMHI